MLSVENKPVMLSVVIMSVVMVNVVAPLEIHSLIIRKLELTGPNLGWVFNSISVCVYYVQLPYFEINLPKLKLKI